MKQYQMRLLLAVFVCCFMMVLGTTDPQDVKVLNDFRKGLENPELLKWPSPSESNDPCGPPLWPHVFCSGTRVNQIQVQNLGLKGSLPPNFNQLSKLFNLGFQHNNFSGQLPSFRGLSELQYAYLGNNQFDTIPSDFFDGLVSLQVMSLDYSPLNKTTGWYLSETLLSSSQLMNLSLISCNLIGPIPDFLAKLGSLSALKLSGNRLTGEIPSSFSGSQLQFLWLNDQMGDEKLSGSIDIVTAMLSLKQLWLNGNKFGGTIPVDIGDCTSLTDLWLDDNEFVGPIPQSLSSLQLATLKLSNNKLTGPIPDLKVAEFTYSGNSFCQPSPGIPCLPEVTALLDFLAGVNYPLNLASSWSGNNSCNNWFGITCNNENGKVTVINLPNYKLNGTLSPSVGRLDSLINIKLPGNNLEGIIPENLTELKSLKLLNLNDNNFDPPVPNFGSSVKILLDGNPKLAAPPGTPSQNSSAPSPSGSGKSSPNSQSPPGSGDKDRSENPRSGSGYKGFGKSKLLLIVIPVALTGVVALSFMLLCWRKKRTFQPSSSFVIHPKDPSDPDNVLKIVVANSNDVSSSNIMASGSQSRNSGGTNEGQVIEVGNLVISVQVLRNVTRNFAPENELGRGGFGAVYKGELDDGTIIAVKRMESSVISNRALDEFQGEIAVLSKVRHRHLVSLLGYSVEGNERLLVYEYMPQGDLSKHLFHWKKLKLEPLSWKRRLNIALDVARGMEYLHSLAHQSFIHRDLKSSNILLGDDFRAKVSDFGLVKLAPDGKQSVVTRLAGTFGYLAPEYAVMGKVTTKADVFSYGVVLMELVTGLTALDEDRPEESRYLAEWFWHIKSSREKLMAAVDPSLDVTEETFESIFVVAELAGHCTAREPNQRPDMGHAVNVLAPLIEKWKPTYDDQEEYLGIDCSQPLQQMVKVWRVSKMAFPSFVGLAISVAFVAFYIRYVEKPPLQSRLWTREELAMYNGTDEKLPILLGILGSVFDVTKGRSHYGLGGGYNHFAGRDASRAFVSGNFTGDGLTDSLQGLSSAEVKSVVDWRGFYFRSYTFVGKLVGRYYDTQGNPTKYLKGVEAKAARGAQLLEKQKNEEDKLRTCNSRWSQQEGGEVWCEEGYPRLLQRPLEIALSGKMSKRCACFKEEELDQPGLELYKDCERLSRRCPV